MSSRAYNLPLECPTTNGADGAAVTAYHLTEKVVHLHTYGTGTHQVQLSMDGSTWTNYGAPFTAIGFLAIPFFCHQIRVHANTATTGTSASIAGVQPRD